jgi:hypothetical protein
MPIPTSGRPGRGVDETGNSDPVGANEPFPVTPMAGPVLHGHRELVRHLCLPRDLDLHARPATNGATR